MVDLTGQTIKIPVASIAKGMTVNIKFTGLRRWHLRLRLGIALMRFAIWVAGMGFKVEGPNGGAANDKCYGGDDHLTELGEQTIGTLREMRARDDPKLRLRPDTRALWAIWRRNRAQRPS